MFCRVLRHSWTMQKLASLPIQPQLTPGAILDVVITNAADTRLLTVTADPKVMSTSILKEDFNPMLGEHLFRTDVKGCMSVREYCHLWYTSLLQSL